LAPADGKLYALRDVTGTVQSIPLIASSVMSKKIAAGAQAIVLDVKTGLGAFMQTIEEARQLARIMVAIGRRSGRRVVALISDMNQPLGEAVGNSLEVKEAIDTLNGGGPKDFKEHCLTVASHLLVVGGKAANLKTGRKLAGEALNSGRALEMFKTLVKVQGGDVRYVDDPGLFPRAKIIKPVAAPKSGTIRMINARIVGETSVDLGAGRIKKGDAIDHSVGIIVHRKVGDKVAKGEAVFTVHANEDKKWNDATERLLSATRIVDRPCEPLPLFYDVIR